jgi:predicted amidohydrolase YtcJ
MYKSLNILIVIFIVALQPAWSQSFLFHNGNIFTSDLKNPFIGYFIIENGKISESGETLPGERIAQFANKIDLQGKTVIPGIVDSHIHFIDGVLGLLQISLSEVSNSNELKNKIGSTSTQLLDGFYVARDLGFSALSEIDSPRDFLDSLIPESPAIIFLKSGHAAIANTLGLKKLGFTSRTKIADGIIGKGKDGKLNGWLLEAAAMQ